MTDAERFKTGGKCKEAWLAIPENRRKRIDSFRNAWVTKVARPGVDPERVVAAIRLYYESPEGRGRWARRPANLLIDELWDESPSAWLGDEEPKAQTALDAAIAASEDGSHE